MARSMLLIAAIAGLTRAEGYKAFALPNGDWAGVDGNWSTVSFLLGQDSQPVDVLVGTALSEFWAVGAGGCYPNEPHCFEARGGLYRPEDSHLWDDLGTWHLGLDHLGFSGNGRYGFDRARAYSDIQDGRVFTMGETLVSAVNTTDHFLGLFGMGIAQGNFKETVARSPLTVAVQDTGIIPSYSYGYTAGAHYRNTPASLTIGGYDKARFVDHTTDFSVSKSDSLLRTLVRGIQVQTSIDQDQPEEWDSDIQLLSQMNTSFTALIDTSTPFLYLPNKICDAFAESLNMTYHDSIDLYGLSNDQYRDFRSEDSFTFTFSLSSTDNNDDFGEPLDVPGVVNITIPMRALVSTVQYPFHDEAIAYGEPAQPYFSLRRSGDNETFVIGRSFFQESYLLTQYDKQVFSIHHALFPDDPNGDADIESIEQPENSPYPPPASNGSGLSKGAIAGIAIGSSAGVVAVLGALWCCWRRRKGRHGHTAVSESEEEKASTESLKNEAAQSNSPLSRIWAKVVRRNRSNSQQRSQPGDSSQPLEAPNTQVYELPAPEAPVELVADDDDAADYDDLGLQGQSTSAYEQQRLKLDRQLAGPVPEYTPPSSEMLPPPEKAGHHYEVRSVPERRPVPAPHLAPTQGSVSPPAPESNNSNSFPSNGSMVSPISPGAGWASGSESNKNSNNNNNNSPNTPSPSPMAIDAPQLPLARNQPRSDPNLQESSKSTSNGSVSPSSINLHTANIQRTPIDPSKVVCLGPLPGNVQLRNQPSMPQIIAPDGTQLNPPSFSREDQREYASTLGSNYTEEEERMREYQSQLQVSQAGGSHPLSQSRVPQEQHHFVDDTWHQGQQNHSSSAQAQHQQPYSYTQHTHPEQTQQQAYSSQPYYTGDQLSQWQLAAQAGKQRLKQQWAEEEELRRQRRIQSSQHQMTYQAPSHPEHPPQPTYYAQNSQATYVPGGDDGMGGMMEFIHVPQPAEKRFSWEEDRSTY